MNRTSLLFLVVIAQTLSAQISSPIPSSRVIDWTNSGIPGGIPDRTTISTTINASTYGNGAEDATAGIQSALNACPADQVVYLSAGTFKIESQLSVPSNVTLRGAGPQQTILNAHDSAKALVTFGQNAELQRSSLIPITAGLTAGTTSITVSYASTISVGQLLVVSQLNDPAYVSTIGVGGNCSWCDVGYGGTRTMGQTVEVVSKNGNVIGISPGLYFDYTRSLSPSVSVFTPGAEYAGVEDLQVYMNNSGYTTNFLMEGSTYCWIKNIESNYADGDHIDVYFSYRCEIRDSYFHDAYIHVGGQTDGCIFIARKSSGILVENNQLRRLHVSVMINWGASGNVIAYNFSESNFSSKALNVTKPTMSLHGAHPMFNLWEGNIATKLSADSYWGSSSHNTAFRNWFRGTTKIFPPYSGRGPEQPDDYHWAVQANSAITLDFACRTYNLAGNVVGSPDMLQLTSYNNGTTVLPTVPVTVAPTIRVYDSKTYGYAFGYASSGDNGTSSFANNLPYTTAFVHGDVNLSDDSSVWWDEATEDHVLPPSLYLVLKPTWFGTIPWPAIGPDVAGFYNQNPAQVCYSQGQMPNCLQGTAIPEPTGTISGTVTDSITGNPLEAARVSYGTRYSITDADGYYTFTDVIADTFSLTVSLFGYLPQSDSAIVTEDSTATVDFQLIRVPSGNISGTVTDSITGNPVQGAAVTDGIRSDSTDAEGNYMIKYVPVSTYTVTASISDYLPLLVEGVVVAKDRTTLVDLQLHRVPTGTISGTVTDTATGHPVEGALVSNEITSVTTDADGNYMMEGLLLDIYTVSASASGYKPLSTDGVAVTKNNTSTVDFQLTPFPDLVGFWAFEESSGTIAFDSTSNHNDGIIHGPISTSGISDLALQFDGTDDYVTIPKSISLDDITKEITLMAWIRVSSGSRHSIFERWLSGPGVEERSFLFDVKKSQVYFGLSGDGTNNDTRFLLSSGTVPAETWTHVAATSDGSEMKIYINGVPDLETKTSPLSIHPSAADLHIGQGEFVTNGWDYPFNGTMDQVKIYNRALNAQEVEADYNLAFVGIEKNLAPEKGVLQVYPNPFNDETTISYKTTVTGRVGISIYNMSGQKIRTLVSAIQQADDYTVVWDGTKTGGEPAGSGIFICAFDFDYRPVVKRKLVLL